MNYEKLGVFVQILEFAIICTPVSTGLNQAIKKLYKKWNTTIFNILSCIVSVAIGYFMAREFGDFTNAQSVFNGIVLVIGAKGLYEALNKIGLISSINDNKNKNIVEIPKENEIKGE